MGESIITMSIVGLITGFIFSMPIAGPISILVTSNALKGRMRYCNLVAIGASFADFVYVYIAVFGITKLYRYFKPAMPYFLGLGALFIIYVGYRVFRSKLDLEHLEEIEPKTGKPIKKHKGGFYTGFMVNFLNPTLIFGWLTTSVLVISFISALGFNTGGLDTMVDQNVKALNSSGHQVIENSRVTSYLKPDSLKIFRNHVAPKPATLPAWFPLTISFSYALALSLGSIAWFILLALTIARFRHRINIRILHWIIRGLGIILCCFGVFFAYSAIKMLV
jgi:threonine/homoserine/homoserine lactone efflux protein